jgi:DNA (cytosine-5)-methyltransferase 1
MTLLMSSLLGKELVVDNFAGGGGASTGIEAAIGRSVDIAINHDAEAIAMHTANHPATEHYCEDVFSIDPVKVTNGDPVGLAWFSPDCKHFSKAKGGKPVSKNIRGLAWVVVRWAETVRPRLIMLENVEEFQTWCPLLEDGRPDPTRKGETFREWVSKLRALGYVVEWRELKAADYGAPTSRKRLFVIARCDGQPIVWPEPTHGKGRLPYRTAAECIDWSIPCPSIFERKKPLAEATMRRIVRGVRRYVIEAAEPFIVTMRGTDDSHIDQSVRSIREPVRTVSSAGMHHALAVPTLIQTSYGERKGQAPRVPGLEKPIGTLMAQGQKHALVAAFLARHYGGHENDGSDLRIPFHTVTAKDHHSLVHAFLIKYYGVDQNPEMLEPLHTVTTKHRFALVTVAGEQYYIADIGMRMLAPHELFRAQGFRSDYIINPLVKGKPLTKTAQIRMCGNSVCPPLAEALVRANYVEQSQALAA